MHSRLVTFLIVLFCGASVQSGGIYWTDRGSFQLKRMNFDGSGLSNIVLQGAVTAPGNNIRGIAVDNVRERIIWADNGADRLLRANFDGTQSSILHTITGGNSFPADVRIDFQNQHLYWCDRDRRRIQRSTLDGGSVITNVNEAAATGPYFMDVDVSAGKLYWGDFEGGAIYRANLDGSNKELLLTGNNNTRGVCVDTNGGMLYWINRDDSKVHRCPLAAFTNGTIALTHPAVQTLYTNLDTPHGLVLDVPARKLYWADTGTNPGAGTGEKAVSRGDLDGSTPMEVLASGIEPWDVDLDRRCANYAEWRMRCFRRDAPPEQTAPDADPDGDGIVNVLEYAFDLAPLYADGDGLPAALDATGLQADYQMMKFRRRAGTTDLVFLVQASTNLLNWTGSVSELPTEEVEVKPLGDNMEEVTVRTRYPVTNHSAHFLRLTVRLQQPD